MLLLEIIVSLFAAWGVFCAMKLVADAWLVPAKFRPVPALRLEGNESEHEIASLIENARSSWLTASGEMVMFIPDDDTVAAKVHNVRNRNIRIIREERPPRDGTLKTEEVKDAGRKTEGSD